MSQSQRKWLWALLLFISSVTTCLAQCIVGIDNSTSRSFDHDPILELQPTFARSLPVQILLTGVVFTLVAVLLLHLIFTGQYHWPLAPVNYILQVSGVLTLLISLIATLHVILSTALSDSKSWPYMLTYIAVDIPPSTDTSGWTTAELAGWYAMDATTSALVQITHIQFLTLLYPSELEARLIFCLLGPLAVLSASMELLPIHQTQRVIDVADVVRNTCNAALSLLFTTALFIWGFLVNRKQAWRTDGGTAAFGAGALILTLISTALNFLYIPTKDTYVWLPRLMWAVVLWQSFLGWWWWVGGGMGVGEVEDMLQREEKRERKRMARLARRMERKEKAQSFWRSASETLALTYNSTRPTVQADPAEEPMEMTAIPNASSRPTPDPSIIDTQQSTVTTSGISSTAFGTVYHRLQTSTPGRFFRKWYGILRHAHLKAARVQAIRRVERRQQVYGDETVVTASSGNGVFGWGLGSFGIRELERREDIEDEEDEDEQWSNQRRGTAGKAQAGHSPTPTRPPKTDPKLPGPKTTSWSMWLWGPLQRWRLKDSTVY